MTLSATRPRGSVSSYHADTLSSASAALNPDLNTIASLQPLKKMNTRAIEYLNKLVCLDDSIHSDFPPAGTSKNRQHIDLNLPPEQPLACLARGAGSGRPPIDLNLSPEHQFIETCPAMTQERILRDFSQLAKRVIKANLGNRGNSTTQAIILVKEIQTWVKQQATDHSVSLALTNSRPSRLGTPIHNYLGSILNLSVSDEWLRDLIRLPYQMIAQVPVKEGELIELDVDLTTLDKIFPLKPQPLVNIKTEPGLAPEIPPGGPAQKAILVNDRVAIRSTPPLTEIEEQTFAGLSEIDAFPIEFGDLVAFEGLNGLIGDAAGLDELYAQGLKGAFDYASFELQPVGQSLIAATPATAAPVESPQTNVSNAQGEVSKSSKESNRFRVPDNYEDENQRRAKKKKANHPNSRPIQSKASSIDRSGSSKIVDKPSSVSFTQVNNFADLFSSGRSYSANFPK